MRVPLSGAVGGRFGGDIVLPLLGRELCANLASRSRSGSYILAASSRCASASIRSPWWRHVRPSMAPTLEQIFVGRVLNERVLEAIIAFGRQALHNVGFGELLQRSLQGCILDSRHVANERVGEPAADHRADLRYLARRAKPVQPRHQRLLQHRRNRLDAAASLAALQQKPRHFLDEQRHAASPRGDVLHHVVRQRVAGGSSATISCTWPRSSGASEMVL